MRLVVVDDHSLFREVFCRALDDAGMEIAGAAGSAADALNLILNNKPDVVLMDLELDGVSGFDVIKSVRSKIPNQKILIISAHKDIVLLKKGLRVGASGYLTKESLISEVLLALETINTDKKYVSPELQERLLGHQDGPPPIAVLTSQQKAVLRQIVEQPTLKAAAAELTISVKTVEKHRRNILDKLGLDSTVDLVRYAIREQLVPLSPPGKKQLI